MVASQRVPPAAALELELDDVVLLEGFREGALDFCPTYKYVSLSAFSLSLRALFFVSFHTHTNSNNLPSPPLLTCTGTSGLSRTRCGSYQTPRPPAAAAAAGASEWRNSSAQAHITHGTAASSCGRQRLRLPRLIPLPLGAAVRYSLWAPALATKQGPKLRVKMSMVAASGRTLRPRLRLRSSAARRGLTESCGVTVTKQPL